MRALWNDLRAVDLGLRSDSSYYLRLCGKRPASKNLNEKINDSLAENTSFPTKMASRTVPHVAILQILTFLVYDCYFRL